MKLNLTWRKLTAFFLALVFSGCGQNRIPVETTMEETSVETTTEMTTQMPETEPQQPEPPLTVYLYGTAAAVTQILAEQYQTEYPEREIVVEDCTSMNTASFRTRLLSEMETGGGPDVMLFSAQNSPLADLAAVIGRGYLRSLDGYELHLDECLDAVLAAGVYREQQMLLPLTFGLNFLYSTAERLDAAGIPYGEGVTLSEFADAVGRYQVENPECYVFRSAAAPSLFLLHSGVDAVDHKNGILREEAEVRNALETLTEAYADLFPEYYGEDGVNGSGASKYSFALFQSGKKYANTLTDPLFSGDLLFLGDSSMYGGNRQLLTYINMYYFETVRAGETPVCITLPTLDGGAPAPIVQYYAVVNANSASDTAVRDFLQCALSTRFQYQLVQKNSALPVNRTMLDQMEEFYRTPGENTDMPYTFLKVTEFPADFVDTYFSRIREMRPGVFMDSNWIFGVSEYTRNRWILGASSEEAACAAEQILDKYQSGSGTSGRK